MKWRARFESGKRGSPSPTWRKPGCGWLIVIRTSERVSPRSSSSRFRNSARVTIPFLVAHGLRYCRPPGRRGFRRMRSESLCAALAARDPSQRRNAPPKRGITVVMGCVSRSLNLRASRTQTVSPWSRRAREVDICQSDTCRPDTCQPEREPEAAALCEADRQQRQRSASQRMQPLRSESSA